MRGCPYHSESSDDQRGENPGEADKPADESGSVGIERRDFVRSAMLIGGATAVSGLGSAAGMTPNVSADSGRISAAARENRQHARDEFEVKNAPFSGTGHSAQPPNVLILGLNYLGPDDGADGDESESDGEGAAAGA